MNINPEYKKRMEYLLMLCGVGAVAMGIATIGRSPPEDVRREAIQTVEQALVELDKANTELQRLGQKISEKLDELYWTRQVLSSTPEYFRKFPGTPQFVERSFFQPNL